MARDGSEVQVMGSVVLFWQLLDSHSRDTAWFPWSERVSGALLAFYPVGSFFGSCFWQETHSRMPLTGRRLNSWSAVVLAILSNCLLVTGQRPLAVPSGGWKAG